MFQRALARLGLAAGVDRYLLVVSVILLAWSVVPMLWSSGRLPSPTSPYVIAPVMLLVGLVAGRWLRTRAADWAFLVTLALLASSVLLAAPFYANAEAALGLQLVALAGLTVLASPSDARNRSSTACLVTLAVIVGVLGVPLTARSQAASLLVVPIVVITTVAVLRRTGPSRHLLGAFGFLSVGVAAVVVISLGSLSRWPETMNAGERLSSARHRLWSDALQLWRTHPFTGGGPGSFAKYSELAASTPDLGPVHSSILQIGSELGIVGAVLFLGVLLAGAAVGAQGGQPQALIAVAAWSALGIHSMIDHLYGFPILTLTAGIVLGFAGRVRQQDSYETA